MHLKNGVGAPRKRTVFASYAHDSATHKGNVLTFAQLLIRCGVNVVIDQLARGRQDWSSWAISQMTSADYIVVVASPEYRRAGDGNGPPMLNRGVQSETAVLRDLLHSDRSKWLPRLLPVVLPGHDISEIPLFLQPYTADHYLIDELTEKGVQELLTVIHHPEIPLPRQEMTHAWRVEVRVEVTIFPPEN
jgi:hypothetical protein